LVEESERVSHDITSQLRLIESASRQSVQSIELSFNAILILLDQILNSWQDSLCVLLELLPCFQVASFHHDTVVLQFFSRESFVAMNLLLQWHQVILVKLVKVVFTVGITPVGKSLLRETHQSLRESLQVYYILVLL
jgi:hypothetical protein